MSIILLLFVFIRPFICSLAYPHLNEFYSVLFLIFLTVYLIVKNSYLKKFDNLKPALILFILALIISSLFSQNILKSLKEMYKYSSGILLLLIIGSLGPENKTRIEKTVLLCALIISFLAIYQYFFGFRHTLYYLAKQGISRPFLFDYIGRKRVFFPFVTPNILASYLIMMILIAWHDKNSLWVIIPLTAALFLTQSLGAILSLSLVIFLFLRLSNKSLKKIALFSILFLIIIYFLIMLRSSATQAHVKPSFSTDMRLSYWNDTIDIIKRFPFTGVGAGNFNLKFSRYAHNSYLQIWAEMGILGVLALIWLIFGILKNNLQSIKASKPDYHVACLMAANLAFLMHNFVDFGFFLPEVSLLWWVILGLSCD